MDAAPSPPPPPPVGLKARFMGIFSFVKGIFTYLSEHDWMLYAAGLSFYAIISMSPFIILAVAVGGFFFGSDVAQNELYEVISREAGQQSAELVLGFAEGAKNLTTISIASAISFVLLIWSSTALLTHIRSALHATWEIIPRDDPETTIWQTIFTWLRQRLFAALATLIFGALFIALVATRLILTFVEDGYTQLWNIAFWVWDIIDITIAIVFITLFTRVIFHILPDRRLSGWAPWIGSLLVALLALLGRTGLTSYLSVGTVDSAYGAAGTLVVLMGSAFYMAMIFMFGARFTFVLARVMNQNSDPTHLST